MSKEQLFEKFTEMFPEWAERVVNYKKIGSKCLAIKFIQFGETVTDQTEISRVFLYDNPDNWQFGTKLWRKRPKRLKKKDGKVPKGTREALNEILKNQEVTTDAE